MKIRIDKKFDPIYRNEIKAGTSPVLNLEYSEEKENNGGIGNKNIELLNEDKKVIGRMGFNYLDNNSVLQIKFVVIDPDFQGKQFSFLLYKKIIELAKNKGIFVVKSDNVVQGGAIVNWKRLMDKGFSIKINPLIEEQFNNFLKTYNGGRIYKENFSVPVGESVFEIDLKDNVKDRL